MNEEQISIINWMFNYCRIEMLKRNDEHTYTDIETLMRYIKKRFPDESEQILEVYKPSNEISV